jgi:hypothetical protein
MFIIGLFTWINILIFSIYTDLLETIAFVILDIYVLVLILYVVSKLLTEWRTPKKFIFTDWDITVDSNTKSKIKLDSIAKINMGTKYVKVVPAIYPTILRYAGFIIFFFRPTIMPSGTEPIKVVEFILKDESVVWGNFYWDRNFAEFIVEYCKEHNIELSVEQGIIYKHSNRFINWMVEKVHLFPGFVALAMWMCSSILGFLILAGFTIARFNGSWSKLGHSLIICAQVSLFMGPAFFIPLTVILYFIINPVKKIVKR